MITFFYHFLFLIFTIFVLIKNIYYAIYEVKSQNNKVGGFSFICFSIIVIIFANIVVFLK